MEDVVRITNKTYGTSLLYSAESVLEGIRGAIGFVEACLHFCSLITFLEDKDLQDLAQKRKLPYGFKVELKGRFGTILVDISREADRLSIPAFYVKGIPASLNSAYPVLIVPGEEVRYPCDLSGKGIRSLRLGKVTAVTFTRHAELRNLMLATESKKKHVVVQEIMDTLKALGIPAEKGQNPFEEMEPFPFIQKPVDLPDIKIKYLSHEVERILGPIVAKDRRSGLLVGPFGVKVEM